MFLALGCRASAARWFIDSFNLLSPSDQAVPAHWFAHADDSRARLPVTSSITFCGPIPPHRPPLYALLSTIYQPFIHLTRARRSVYLPLPPHRLSPIADVFIFFHHAGASLFHPECITIVHDHAPAVTAMQCLHHRPSASRRSTCTGEGVVYRDYSGSPACADAGRTCAPNGRSTPTPTTGPRGDPSQLGTASTRSRHHLTPCRPGRCSRHPLYPSGDCVRVPRERRVPAGMHGDSFSVRECGGGGPGASTFSDFSAPRISARLLRSGCAGS